MYCSVGVKKEVMMICNCFYEECDSFADIIYVPDLIENIEECQKCFFEWLFDKKNEHPYWIIVDSEKKYCSYGTQAFVEWLNVNTLQRSIEKAYFIKKDAPEWNEDNVNLFF